VFDQAAEVRRRRKLMWLPGFALLAGAIRVVFLLSTTTEQRLRDQCAVDLPPVVEGGSTIHANLPCHPYEVKVVAAWQAPALIVVIAVIVIGFCGIHALMPRLTQAPPVIEATGITPLKGRHRRDRLTLWLQPVGRWTGVVLGTCFLGAAALLFFLPSGAPLAIDLLFGVVGAGFLAASNASSVVVTPVGLKARMLLVRRRWAWDDIKRISTKDGLNHTGYRIRLLVVEPVRGEPFARETLASAPGRKRLARADRAVAAIEEYRASLGHVTQRAAR
jgi:hypothetical protein